uniref:Uncharacterized protein n=1 Tax=Fagus sylvatica TaxID=28930 RepID=A0A2N9GJV9_FAGSY
MPIWVWVKSISTWWWSRGLNVLGTGDIAGKNFWNEHSGLLKELGGVVVVAGFWMVEWVTEVEKRRRKEK